MSTAAAEINDSDQPVLEVKSKYVRVRLALQIGIATVCSGILLYLTLLSDRHNDGRYIGKDTYQQDRQADDKLRQQVDGETRRRLDEIGSDVKTLLRESRSKP